MMSHSSLSRLGRSNLRKLYQHADERAKLAECDLRYCDPDNRAKIEELKARIRTWKACQDEIAEILSEKN